MFALVSGHDQVAGEPTDWHALGGSLSGQPLPHGGGQFGAQRARGAGHSGSPILPHSAHGEYIDGPCSAQIEQRGAAATRSIPARPVLCIRAVSDEVE